MTTIYCSYNITTKAAKTEVNIQIMALHKEVIQSNKMMSRRLAAQQLVTGNSKTEPTHSYPKIFLQSESALFQGKAQLPCCKIGRCVAGIEISPWMGHRNMASRHLAFIHAPTVLMRECGPGNGFNTQMWIHKHPDRGNAKEGPMKRDSALSETGRMKDTKVGSQTEKRLGELP